MVDIEKILGILPHRYPFILLDRILEIESGKSAVGIKNVTINEPYFQGHFPDQPIMPGVLLIEALAQVGGILALGSEHEAAVREKNFFFSAIDKVRFRKPVIPGDQVRLEVEVLKRKGNFWRLKGKGFVEDFLVVQAEFMGAIVDKKESNHPEED